MTWENVPPPSDRRVIPVSHIENWQEMLDYFENMSEEEARAYLQTILDAMTFEEQAEFLRELDDGGSE